MAKNGNDVTGVGSLISPFSTIQKAVTLANNNSIGTTVNVMPGVYTENLNLTNENVSIVGYGSYPGQQLNTTLVGNHTCTPSSGTNSIYLAGLLMANPTPSTFMIDMTGASAGSLTLNNCVMGDTGTSTIYGYVNMAGPHSLTMSQCKATCITQSTITALVNVSSATATISLCTLATSQNAPIIQTSGSSNALTLSFSGLSSVWNSGNAGTNLNGVVHLGSVLGSVQTHSIVNCGINSSALASSASVGGVPAVGLDATGSALIFNNNICLTRYWVGGAMTGDAIASTGIGATANTFTYYEGSHATINNFARGIIGSGNYNKAQMLAIN